SRFVRTRDRRPLRPHRRARSARSPREDSTLRARARGTDDVEASPRSLARRRRPPFACATRRDLSRSPSPTTTMSARHHLRKDQWHVPGAVGVVEVDDEGPRISLGPSGRPVASHTARWKNESMNAFAAAWSAAASPVFGTYAFTHVF